MQTDELDELIQRLEREITQRQKDLEAAKRFRDALPRLTSADGAPSKKPDKAVQMPLNGSGLGEEYGAAANAIRKAISDSPKDYTVYDVEHALHANGVNLPRLIISQTLSRLAKAGEVRVKHRGKGRRPGIFTKDGH